MKKTWRRRIKKKWMITIKRMMMTKKLLRGRRDLS